VPLFLGGFTDKALERTVKYGDGYFGNIEACDLYRQKLQAAGKDPASARIRLLDLFLVVAHDPERALHELAPYFHHVNNSYGEWANEDLDATGFSEERRIAPMTLEAFKTSGVMRVLTPNQAIAFFNDMRAKSPFEHFMMMVPPGLPPSKFMPYAETFAREVIPAFR
jgi:alkanesulfonate monooxygenase SsuD/methylene tetrahydromethanopterin reductase-like flavin-dependent oxidoreductase (luciferase family)